MSGRKTQFTSRRLPGARQRRTSADTAAAFLASFHARGGNRGHNVRLWQERTAKIRARLAAERLTRPDEAGKGRP